MQNRKKDIRVMVNKQHAGKFVLRSTNKHTDKLLQWSTNRRKYKFL